MTELPFTEEEGLISAIERISNSSTSTGELDKIYLEWSQNFTIGCKLAEDPRTSKETLFKLGMGNYINIIDATLTNPNCPRELFDHWVEEGSYGRILSIVKNPECPTEVLVRIYRDKGETRAWFVVNDRIERHPNFPVDLGEWTINIEEWC
jgi:hypothetical protein